MKLIRDKTPDLLRGSTRQVRDLDEFRILLRMKLAEEAAEVSASTSSEEMTKEFGDLLEVMYTLLAVESITLEAVIAAKDEKLERKGGFSGLVLMHDPLSNKTTATI